MANGHGGKRAGAGRLPAIKSTKDDEAWFLELLIFAAVVTVRREAFEIWVRARHALRTSTDAKTKREARRVKRPALPEVYVAVASSMSDRCGQLISDRKVKSVWQDFRRNLD